VKVFAVDEFGGDVGSVAVAINFVDGGEVGVAKLSRCPALAKKSQCVSFGEVFDARNLDGDRSLETRVPRFPDVAHGAGAKHLVQFERTDAHPGRASATVDGVVFSMSDGWERSAAELNVDGRDLARKLWILPEVILARWVLTHFVTIFEVHEHQLVEESGLLIGFESIDEIGNARSRVFDPLGFEVVAEAINALFKREPIAGMRIEVHNDCDSREILAHAMQEMDKGEAGWQSGRDH
jgi:hypothetical protein